jgi:hypothetical protein
VPGSCKANFPRPSAIAWPYGSEPDGQAFAEDTDDGSVHVGPLPLLYETADYTGGRRSGLRAPDGLLQLTPDAGDFIVMSERCAHCILAWQPTDRPRVALNLRYYSGSAWARMERNMSAGSGDLDDALTVESVGKLDGLALCTRAMVAGRGITAWGEEPSAPRL